jgi:hypothetical protein
MDQEQVADAKKGPQPALDDNFTSGNIMEAQLGDRSAQKAAISAKFGVQNKA